jgi:hypothetical protein
VYLSKSGVSYHEKFQPVPRSPAHKKAPEQVKDPQNNLREILVICKKLGDMLKQDVVRDALGTDKVCF